MVLCYVITTCLVPGCIMQISNCYHCGSVTATVNDMQNNISAVLQTDGETQIQNLFPQATYEFIYSECFAETQTGLSAFKDGQCAQDRKCFAMELKTVNENATVMSSITGEMVNIGKTNLHFIVRGCYRTNAADGCYSGSEMDNLFEPFVGNIGTRYNSGGSRPEERSICICKDKNNCNIRTTTSNARKFYSSTWLILLLLIWGRTLNL